MNILRHSVAALLLLVGTATQAQTLGEVEQRLTRLEHSMGKSDQHRSAAVSPSVPESVIAELHGRLAAMERMVSSLVASQELDHRSVAVASELLQRFKGDAEVRLDALDKQIALLASAPQAAPAPVVEARAATPDDRFSEALGFAEKQEWSKAEFAFDTFIANNPQHPRLIEARYWLGRSFLGEGKAPQAAQVFLDIYEKYPTAPIALDNLFALADALAVLGPDSAAQACDVYTQVEGDFSGKLTNDQRNRILERRIALSCKK